MALPLTMYRSTSMLQYQWLDHLLLFNITTFFVYQFIPLELASFASFLLHCTLRCPRLFRNRAAYAAVLLPVTLVCHAHGFSPLSLYVVLSLVLLLSPVEHIRSHEQLAEKIFLRCGDKCLNADEFNIYCDEGHAADCRDDKEAHGGVQESVVGDMIEDDWFVLDGYGAILSQSKLKLR